jgi:hypothetical protein
MVELRVRIGMLAEYVVLVSVAVVLSVKVGVQSGRLKSPPSTLPEPARTTQFFSHAATPGFVESAQHRAPIVVPKGG